MVGPEGKSQQSRGDRSQWEARLPRVYICTRVLVLQGEGLLDSTAGLI